MGLLWLSAKGDMPFGPTKAQGARLQTPNGLEEAKSGVIKKHREWVSFALCIGCSRSVTTALMLVMSTHRCAWQIAACN